MMKRLIVIVQAVMALSIFPLLAISSSSPVSTVTNPLYGAAIPASLGSYSITGTASPGSGSLTKVEVSTDNGATWANASDNWNGTLAAWSFKWQPLSLGAHSIKTKATNSVGGVETPGAAVRVTVTDKPSSKITYPVNNLWLPASLGTYSVVGTAVDNSGTGLSKVEVTTDGGSTWNNSTDNSGNGSLTSWYYHWAPLGLGAHSIRSRATTVSGKVEDPGTPVNVNVDGTSPTASITSLSDGSLLGNVSSYNVTGTCTDGTGSGVQSVYVSFNNGSTWTLVSGTTNWSYTWTVPTDGIYVVKTKAYDNVGNYAVSAGINVEVDKTPPTGTIVINGNATYTNSKTISLTLTATDPNHACGADPNICGVASMNFNSGYGWGGWETAVSSKTYTLNAAAADGVKTVQVMFRDSAGNMSSTYQKTITLDTAPPTATITSPASGATITSTTATATGTAADSLSGVKQVDVSLDGGATWHTATGTTAWTIDLTVPAAGPYTIAVRPADNAGNANASAATRSVTAKSSLTVNRTSVNFTNTLGWPAASTEVSLSATPWPLTNCTVGSKPSWLTTAATSGPVSAGAMNFPSGSFVLTAATPSTGSYSGNVTFTSTYATNTATTAVSITAVSMQPVPNVELQHYKWGAYSSNGCDLCHNTPSRFLSTDYKMSPELCRSCHNAASNAHEKSVATGIHASMMNVTSHGTKFPTYGNTTGEYSTQMFRHLKSGSKIVCSTCHNSMRKKEDYGRTWEMTTSSDMLTYYLGCGGWKSFGYAVPTVYRDTALWTGPTMSKTKKAYVVNPSEYTYDEVVGSITFKTQQASSVYIYVSLDYPYFRASSEANRICADCHTEATHKGENCMACHVGHETKNIRGIKEKLRTTGRSFADVVFLNVTGAHSFADGNATLDGVCEVCHTATKYYRANGAGFVNHSSGMNYAGRKCTSCHSHQTGFGK